MTRLSGPAPELFLSSLGVSVERVPVSQERQSTMEIEFNWPVGSYPLEAMPVAGRTGCSLRPGQMHTPGSSRRSQHFTTWAEIGLPRGVVISVCWDMVGMTLNPTHPCSSLTQASFSLS